MAKTCIICGERAGSREHIFPAALGGRRTNKGIYCEKHNKFFSPLAFAISKQLKLFNSLIEVRPDHSDDVPPFYYEATSGKKFVIKNGNVELVGDYWSEHHKSNHATFEFGGPIALRAIGYIAVTFFAHHFQEYIRGDEFNEIKNFILGNADNNFVWWERLQLLNDLPKNDFEFGHTIAIVTDGSSGNIFLLISLFNSLNFMVKIGNKTGIHDKTVLIFINPKEENAKLSVMVSEYDYMLLEIEKPEPLQAHLMLMVSDDVVCDGIKDLLLRIERNKFREEIEPYLVKINDINQNKNREQILFNFQDLVCSQTQRIYRLMKRVVDDLEVEYSDQAHMKVLIGKLRPMVELDKNSKSGRSEACEDCSQEIINNLLLKIMNSKIKNELNFEFLWNLFNTSSGLCFFCKIMVEYAEPGLKDKLCV